MTMAALLDKFGRRPNHFSMDEGNEDPTVWEDWHRHTTRIVGVHLEDSEREQWRPVFEVGKPIPKG